MIGVVVWTDQTFEKAVIWCEDQSDLAYFVRPDQAFSEYRNNPVGEIATPLDAIRKGDMVVFEAYYEGDCRMAKNLRLLAENTHPLLAEYLQADAGEGQAAQSTAVAVNHSGQSNGEASAEILPFICGGSDHLGSQGQSNRRKSG